MSTPAKRRLKRIMSEFGKTIIMICVKHVVELLINHRD